MAQPAVERFAKSLLNLQGFSSKNSRTGCGRGICRTPSGAHKGPPAQPRSACYLQENISHALLGIAR
jgi:hypothetical protein